MFPYLPPSIYYTVKLKRPPCILLLRTFMSGAPSRSAFAPTFSSTGNTIQILSRLSPSRISTMIMTGKPNMPLPPKFQVDLDQFLPAAVSAVGNVTSSMSSGDWDEMEGLVDRDCIANLQNIMGELSKDQKQLVVVNPGDVFMSFVSNPDKCDSGNNLHVVTFSLPRLEEIRNIVKEHKDLADQTKKNIHASVGAVKGDKDKVKETVASLVKEYKAKIASNNPHDIFKANEIVIGNYRFARDGPASEWTITEVAQINSMQAWATIFKLRWRVRLGVAARTGLNFNTILRIDYLNNYMFISFLMVLSILEMMAGQVP